MSFFHIFLLFSTYSAPAIYKDFKTILRKRNYPIGILRWCLRHLEDWGLRRVRRHVWAWLSKTWWKSGNTVNKKTIFTWQSDETTFKAYCKLKNFIFYRFFCVQPMGAEGGDHTKVYVEILNFKLFFRKYIAAPSFIFKQVCS